MPRHVVRIGPREISVEQAPLRTTFIRSHSPFVVTRPHDAYLVIGYHRVIRLIAWILCVLGWPVLLLGLLGLIGLLIKPEAANLVGVALLLLWGGVIGLMGVWLLGPRYRFDTSLGQLTIRHCWQTRHRPLARIVAVQVIDAGKFQSGYAESGGGPANIFSSYQLNLIFDDPSEPRLFVAYNHDFVDMARKARVLADFLHVPLLAAPKFQTIAQSFSQQDSAWLAGGAGIGRFGGSNAPRRLRDRQLPEPYQSWIDRGQPLPADVRLLPRTVSVFTDLAFFLLLGIMFIGMDVLIVSLFGSFLVEDLARGEWGAIVFFAAICSLLAIIPLVLLRRLCITIGARRDLKRGTLRQGILVGVDGVLVRMEPNRCYPISLDRFVCARTEAGGGRGQTLDFVIETLGGPVVFFAERLSVPPDQLNSCVNELRRPHKKAAP